MNFECSCDLRENASHRSTACPGYVSCMDDLEAYFIPPAEFGNGSGKLAAIGVGTFPRTASSLLLLSRYLRLAGQIFAYQSASKYVVRKEGRKVTLRALDAVERRNKRLWLYRPASKEMNGSCTLGKDSWVHMIMG